MIRTAGENDLEAIFALFFEFHQFHARRAPAFLRSMEKPDERSNTALVEAIRKVIAGPDSTLLVLEEGGEIIGLVEIYLQHKGRGNRRLMPRTVGYIQSVIVQEKRRKEGWGKQLVSAAEAWALERRARFMELELWEIPDGPLGFYEKAGYRTLRRTMIKDLPGKSAQ